jgi:hypothetical protein
MKDTNIFVIRKLNYGDISMSFYYNIKGEIWQSENERNKHIFYQE